MRKIAIAASLTVLSLTLASCGEPSPKNPISAASLETAQWNSKAAGELRDRIDRRDEHALDHVAFALPEKGKDGEDRALTDEALRFASALAKGSADPAKLYPIYTLARPDIDLRNGLADALMQGKVGEWLDNLAPKDPHYLALSKAYVALRKGDGQGAPAIPERARPLEPGSTDARIPAIALQLIALGYLDNGSTKPTRYDAVMTKAVQRMQADYGIKPDGIIGSDALEILNFTDGDRARSIGVAMERLRWLERNAPSTRIDVNTATSQLTYWRDGKIVDSRRVVVGEPDTETPLLQSPIYRLVANPTWTVPRSIEKKEIAGKGEGYLRQNNMVWKDGWIVQQPGPKNSLGLVKFDMQNTHAIYLHDTPAKALFNEVQRQRSHGCVRVEDALGFAEILARDAGVLEEWRKARDAGEEGFVALPRKLPVRLMYQTVVVDDGGNAIIRADPYGWDDRVAKALGFPSVAAHRLKSGGNDVGP
ncbi:L,D-transpeptidase family protein [Sphingomonas montanisoli]|uniref:L,D-transpeptidase family protein n=1 Tax=Sphingomonas montanisoli TaxID=2606412 RepID=A0A5D9C283_9SPHN|nr:L,D-transpeptidase family protein [Sphingomonas montanisoli]TZG25726.1 L,D-transpeptidase family protein [Sphingomonas montanisoli]